MSSRLTKLDEIINQGNTDYPEQVKTAIKDLFDKLCFEAEVELDIDLIWLRKRIEQL